MAMLRGLDESEMIGLRRIMWEANQQGQPLMVTSSLLEDRDRLRMRPTFSKLADDLLRYIMGRATTRSEQLSIFDNDNEHDPVRLEVETLLCLGKNAESEVHFFLQYLEEKGLIKLSAAMGYYGATLKPAAFIYAEEHEAKYALSSRCFVAMWFNDKVQLAWQEGIEPAIRRAGYEPFRIDRHEHVNRIDDEILAQIRTSRFLVADFTSEPEKPRGGVYFEAGFALGLDKPVIWTAQAAMQKTFTSILVNTITIFLE
jgi:nucleoside 2-deoxyribosyltransferase